MFEAKQKPVCSWCGSDAVRSDAWALWDPVEQCWVLESTYEQNAYCESCEGDTCLKWIEATEAEKEAMT